jgi:hypothetical protein
MPILPGINHLRAVVALQKAGFRVTRQGKHITMSKGALMVQIPRNNPIKPVTMGSIISKAGLTVDQFRELL